MKTWIAPALGGVALLIAVGSAVSTYRTHQRLDALETAASLQQLGGGSGAAEPTERHLGGGERPEQRRRGRRDEGTREDAIVAALDAAQTASGTASFDLQDPVVREQLLQLVEQEEEARREARHIARSEAFMQSVSDELDAFADERGIQEDVKGQVLVELERRHEEFSSLRHDSREGTISRFDARREMDALREDSDATLAELLGADDFAALDERLWGEDVGRRGRRGP